MKYTAALLVVLATAVTAVPHMHRTDKYTDNNYHSDTSIYTDASICPCGTAFDGTQCVGLVCDTCDDPNFTCSNTHSTLGADGHVSEQEDHYLDKVHKACRLNNDASCHSCPTRSCQYQFGNYWGSGYPCLNLGITVGPGAPASFGPDLTFTPQDAMGNGQVVNFDAYGSNEDVHFCDSDEVVLGGLSCGKDKTAVIVSPATCTHCQVARCIDILSLGKYTWANGADTTGKHEFMPAPAPGKLGSTVAPA